MREAETKMKKGAAVGHPREAHSKQRAASMKVLRGEQA